MTPTGPTPMVFVVDDQQAVRDSLRWLLESIGIPVRDYPTAEAFLRDYEPAQPGCLILDVRMPGMSGLDLQEELARRGIELPTIVITAHAEVPMAVRAVKAGAVDFIQKPFSHELLLDRVKHALELDAQEREIRHRRDEARRRLAALTPREREVIVMVAEGRANKAIAAALGVAIKTVEVHRGRAMEKMQAENLAELIRICLLASAVRENP
jgi:FixJ family two-component response regulator